MQKMRQIMAGIVTVLSSMQQGLKSIVASWRDSKMRISLCESNSHSSECKSSHSLKPSGSKSWRSRSWPKMLQPLRSDGQIRPRTRTSSLQRKSSNLSKSNQITSWALSLPWQRSRMWHEVIDIGLSEQLQRTKTFRYPLSLKKWQKRLK